MPRRVARNFWYIRGMQFKVRKAHSLILPTIGLRVATPLCFLDHMMRLIYFCFEKRNRNFQGIVFAGVRIFSWHLGFLSDVLRQSWLRTHLYFIRIGESPTKSDLEKAGHCPICMEDFKKPIKVRFVFFRLITNYGINKFSCLVVTYSAQTKFGLG